MDPETLIGCLSLMEPLLLHLHQGRVGTRSPTHLSFPVGPTLQTGQFVRAIATGSLASIANQGLANNAQWAVDQVDADFDDESGRVVVTANLVVADTGGFLQRMGFQVNILARI
jgi:hypothetical protein